MASKKLNNKKNNNSGFNINTLKSLCVKYKKYISAAAMLAVLAIVVASLDGSAEEKQDGPDAAQEETTGDAQTDYTLPDEEFEVDAHEEVNALINSYYESFAKGDTAAIEKIAYPISDTEKSYIEMFSKYVEKYEEITCYTKNGIDGDDYLVSVTLDMKFKDVDTLAPGLDFFYVRKDKDGAYYIDNAYSQFNQSNQENETELEINTLITEFEQDDDVVELQEKMQKEYEKAVASDEKLKETVEKTVPDAVSEWVSGFSAQEDTGADDAQKDDSKTDDAEKDDSKTDDSQKDDSEKDDSEKDDSKTDDAEKDTENDSGTDTDEKTDTKDKTSVKKRTIYARTKINIRKKKSVESDILYTVKPGTKMVMYGKSSNGWCKVRYKKKTGYVRLEYMTFDKSKVEKEDDTTTASDQNTSTGSNYIPEGTTIELAESVNVRKSMSESADRVGLAYQGDVVTVIMSYAEGWTKVNWNGQTGYIKTEFLKQ